MPSQAKHRAARQRLGEGDGTLLVGGLLGHRLDCGVPLRVETIKAVVSGRSCTRTPGAKVVPARRVRQVEREHQYSSMSLIRVAVHIRPTVLSRAACQSKVACTPCGPEISMRGSRQVDGMHGEGEAFAGRQDVGEHHLAGLAVDGLRHQRLVGEAHLDPAGQRRDGRVRPVDAPVPPDGLDPVEVVGIGDLGRDDVAERGAVARGSPR